MNVMQKIPFHIVSGFLGSGKTTFLKRIIDQYASLQKIGVIQNEFAPANTDSVELRSNGNNFNLLEINNGSAFCVCLMGNFTRSLEKFIDESQPEVLIIEASGLSDTTSIGEVLGTGKLGEKIYLASNWCIVDALNYSKAGLQKQRVIHQLRMADVVVINKTDLLSSGLSELKKEILSINPFAEIKEASYCNIDIDLGKNAFSKFYFSDEQALARPNINSMVIKGRKKVKEDSLRLFLNTWSAKSIRIKGFANLTNGKSVAIQCTFGSVQISEIENLAQPAELIALTTEFTLHEWNKSFKELT